MDFHITSIKICAFTSGQDLIEQYEKAFIFNCLLNNVMPIIINKKPYFKARSEITVMEGVRNINLYISINILFNILVVILSLIKSVWGKIYGK